MSLLAWRHALLAAVIACFLVAPGSRAQAKRAMTLLDLMELPRLLDPQLSPDGRALLYTLNRADWKADRRLGHIWRQEIGGGEPRQLTTGDTGETFARWSPDGATIFYLRGGQIYLVPAGGAEPRQLTRHASNVTAPAWAPDGSAVYFLASDPKTDGEKERDRLKDDIYAFEENGKPRHLWKVTVTDGAERQISTGATSVIEYRVSRDGQRVAFHRAPSSLDDDSERGDIWIMDASGENARALTHNAIGESEAELSPDGSQVLFLADANDRLEPYYSSAIFLVQSAGGTPRRLLHDFPYWVEHATWAPDGRSILAVVNMGVHSEIVRFDLDGHPTPLTDGRHSIPPGGWMLVPRLQRMAIQFDEPTRFGDVWTIDLSGGAPSRVTGVYDSVDREFQLPRQEKVEWKGADGTSIEGLLFYPLDYEQGKRYPLVTQLHGGPRESDRFGFSAGSNSWNDYMQVLAARGYAVLRPNYRGSIGYGDAFLRDLVGGYFKNQHLDVMAGIDALIASGIADPDRLAVMGWSAGGHLTNKLITFTNRFKAASAGAGASNWVAMYAQTDTRIGRALWFGGTPWEKDAPIDVYWQNSPLKDAARVTTPTLFIVGENDQRVPMPQSVEMFRALKANGAPTRLYVAPREGHNWTELRHQMGKGNAELEWFERYVTGRAYAPEKPPGEEPAPKATTP